MCVKISCTKQLPCTVQMRNAVATVVSEAKHCTSTNDLLYGVPAIVSVELKLKPPVQLMSTPGEFWIVTL